MSETNTTLHLTCCDCPHVNIVIKRGDEFLHFACGPDKAQEIAEEILVLAAEGRRKLDRRLRIGHA